MRVLVGLLLLLAMTGHSSATYCLCKDGVGDKQLQTTIDYACGAGADCSPIQQSGACFQPNTVKAHCDWAANSYFQRKGQASGSCDFSGTATPSVNAPLTVASGCVYPSSPINTGTPTSTPTSTPTGTTPTNGTTPPSTTIGGATSPGVFPGTTTGLGPSVVPNQNDAVSISIKVTDLVFSFVPTLLFSGLCIFGQ